MTPNDVLLSNLCQGETLDQARVLLRLAQKKTGPGSGHELGAHTTGLPAICAYLASQRLNNGDVTKKTAQAASCLKTSDFEKAYQVVKAALGSARRKEVIVVQTYEGLMRQYEPAVDHGLLLGWMNAAGRALLQSDSKLNHEDPSEGSDIKSAIFFWTYNASTGKNLMPPQEFAQQHSIPPRTLTKLLQKLSGCSASLKIRIQNEIKGRPRPSSPSKGPTNITTPRRSPKKPPVLRALPSKDSPAKRKQDLQEQHNPDRNETDAPEPERLDALVTETPTKRRRTDFSSPTKHDRPSPTKLVFPPVASSSRVTLDMDDDDAGEVIPSVSSPEPSPARSQATSDAMDVDPVQPRLAQADESDDADVERPVRRRFRPVYLDHKQWYSSDRRLKRVWKQAERHKAALVEMYGHPLESLRA